MQPAAPRASYSWPRRHDLLPRYQTKSTSTHTLLGNCSILIFDRSSDHRTSKKPPQGTPQSPPEYTMSHAETERFLEQCAATTPLPDGPGQGTLIDYDVLCKSVESYLKSIRAEIFELPVELRPSENMQLYQARQTTILEFCK